MGMRQLRKARRRRRRRVLCRQLNTSGYTELIDLIEFAFPN